MRPLLLSLGASILFLGAVWAQNSDENSTAPQIPVGQTSKQFVYPVYQNGILKYTLYAAELTGITLNRAETTTLKIQSNDKGVVTTTITSPKADVYISEQKMQTKNTVHIERDDFDATSQDCDFDLKTKKYVMRTNVKVLLKHFDFNPTPSSPHASSAPGPAAAATNAPSASPSPASTDSK